MAIGLGVAAAPVGNTESAAHNGNLIPREVALPDGTLATVNENKGLMFTARQDQPHRAARSSSLDKRMTYTKGGRDDYCGETTPQETFGPATPLASDCLSIAYAYAYPTDGFWTITPSDFNSTVDGLDGEWATIATSGTCAFKVKFQEPPAQTLYFGTNDLRFYIQTYVGDAQDGHIQVWGNIACNNNQPTVLFLNSWVMTHS
ncbi:hypothetical protein QBC46DRAFT_323473 [Diplogelasinospora grovesii]|uniref:Ecp2 effector protein-like domain-containing protein n=1 Tax=Diplogelasinospora grovesii TaxID=303347 RepID=A0AAN6MXP1_9PEZI|nr:hypothetical protein QBC46DRAFT_323473 [Diplogelasinospora grovesii]